VPKKEWGGTRPQGVVPLLSKGPPLSGGPPFSVKEQALWGLYSSATVPTPVVSTGMNVGPDVCVGANQTSIHRLPPLQASPGLNNLGSMRPLLTSCPKDCVRPGGPFSGFEPVGSSLSHVLDAGAKILFLDARSDLTIVRGAIPLGESADALRRQRGRGRAANGSVAELWLPLP
jgi:hypothetical protein